MVFFVFILNTGVVIFFLNQIWSFLSYICSNILFPFILSLVFFSYSNYMNINLLDISLLGFCSHGFNFFSLCFHWMISVGLFSVSLVLISV